MASSDIQAPQAMPVSLAAVAGFWIGLLACLLLMIAGPLYRAHMVSLYVALRILIPTVLVLGVIALVLSLFGAVRSGFRAIPLAGVFFGLIAAGLPAKNINTALHSPIHDVSTDPANPPQFSSVLPLRAAAKATNSTDYDARTAQQQKETYPDIGPLHLDLPAAQAYDKALTAASGMGWEIVSTDPSQGRIEATATTFWFGFKDDIAVRLSPEGSGTRVDVRSLSRIGKSDVGANARRVRAYLEKLRAG